MTTRNGDELQGAFFFVDGKHDATRSLKFECIGTDEDFTAIGHFDHKYYGTYSLATYQLQDLTSGTEADMQVAQADQKKRAEQQAALKAAMAQEQAQERAQMEAEAREHQEALLAEAQQFRSQIKVGSETNCGPVLELRAQLAKVYAPVKDYGNEHWIPVDQLFPPSTVCRFVNGQYDPPL